MNLKSMLPCDQLKAFKLIRASDSIVKKQVHKGEFENLSGKDGRSLRENSSRFYLYLIQGVYNVGTVGPAVFTS